MRARIDRDKTVDFLLGLDDEQFGNIRFQIIGTEPVPDLNCVYFLVTQEEPHRHIVRTRDDRTDSVAFAARPNKRPLVPNKSCSHCGRTNHRVDTCFELIGFPTQFARGGGRGRASRGGSSSGGRGSIRHGSAPHTPPGSGQPVQGSSSSTPAAVHASVSDSSGNLSDQMSRLMSMLEASASHAYTGIKDFLELLMPHLFPVISVKLFSLPHGGRLWPSVAVARGVQQLFLKRCKKKVLKSQDSTPRRRSGRLMNVMFRTKTKLHGEPEQIDLVGDESAQTGKSIEGEGISEDGDKEIGEVQPNARVDVVRNRASPTEKLTDGEEENSDDEVANDDDGEERDEDEADIDGEEGSDDDGSESDGAQSSGDQESEEYEGDDNENDDDTSGGQGEDSRVQGGSVKGKTPRADCMSVERSSRRTIKTMKKGKERLQRAEVERIGFGSVLRLDIWELPSRLGLWVVSNYDARSSCLKLPDSTKMHITAEDVNTVLGWPVGGERVQNNKRNKDKSLLNEWRLKFDTTGIKITPNDVVEKMLECTEGGEWFVRHFVTLIVSMLVDSTSHGYVNALVMDNLRDVERVPRLDWCQYVLDKLIEIKLKWEKKKKQLFSGPLLFLLVFYVDRVSDFSRTVPRTYPAVLAWSGKELWKRENSEVTEGGFGLGHDDGRMSREARIQLNGDMNEREQDAVGDRDETEQENLIVEDSEEVLVRKIADKSKILESTIIDLLNMIQDAPKSMEKNLMFRKMRNVCHKVIGINVAKKATIEQDVENNETDMSEDSDFWSSPDLWAAVDEAEKAAEVRKKYEDFINDVPSFSLGMTQALEEDVESNRENAKSSEGNEVNDVNQVVTPANRTPIDSQHTPNMDVVGTHFIR
ncbi:unnamed protein product [Cuscuta campestris]|uniref:Uncharacterized protein n=1 Tax=Cuscuta campestris TaxID=132261 RepID=A0A484KWZ4_9ASTE|nr:unnamed protein product [Cuscuta campestris]